MKNILLMVPRLNIGGAETYTSMVAKSLYEQGYNVYVASGGGALARDLVNLGIHHLFLPMRFSTDISAFLLKRIINKYQIELIHANSAAAGITAVKYKQRYNPAIKIVYTAHGQFSRQNEALLENCDKLICVSEYLHKHALTEGFSPDKLVTIYTGIDRQRFNAGETTSLSRAELNIPEEAFTLALVARIKNLHNKGHQDILNILSQYNFATSWHAIIVGKGRAFNKLKKEIRRLGLTERVHCVGHQLEVARYIAVADAMVQPSKFETFGLALAEGMSMGKPGVAYAVGGCPEVIRNEVTGWLIEPFRQDALADRLNSWSANRELCRHMGQAAAMDIAKRFNWQQMMEELTMLYRQTIQQED